MTERSKCDHAEVLLSLSLFLVSVDAYCDLYFHFIFMHYYFEYIPDILSNSELNYQPHYQAASRMLLVILA